MDVGVLAGVDVFVGGGVSVFVDGGIDGVIEGAAVLVAGILAAGAHETRRNVSVIRRTMVLLNC